MIGSETGPVLQDLYTDGDKRWKEELFERLPAIGMPCFRATQPAGFRYSLVIHPATLEEVEHPPGTVACHMESYCMQNHASRLLHFFFD